MNRRGIEETTGTAGDAPTVVLIHGWAGSFDGTYGSNGWREALAARGRAVSELDLPGHGDPAASDQPEEYGDLATKVQVLLPDGQVDVVAFSLGAKLTLEMAVRDPGKFRRIVIAGLGDGVFQHETGQRLADVVQRGMTADERAAMPDIAGYLARTPSNRPDAMAALLRRPPNPVLPPERLARITAKVLILNGDADTIAIPDDGLRAALQNHEYVSLPGVDHFTMPERPEFLAAAIEFLTRD